jgi:hypothetical protein
VSEESESVCPCVRVCERHCFEDERDHHNQTSALSDNLCVPTWVRCDIDMTICRREARACLCTCTRTVHEHPSIPARPDGFSNRAGVSASTCLEISVCIRTCTVANQSARLTSEIAGGDSNTINSRAIGSCYHA